ncbi:ABC transporter ATP-binding protein [Streptomyces coffeae]|uniref:ABC transporter ATP-binding protein n=1 Tax=Streptomyces coffeae TaxID=621382 RepID=A0ABS1NMD4_9ACTN|nr:ABC transporter ATP-binding protein [Streptomyces coffeae]MBL1101062.1 ABC transporter ATP-binding protein [Streptomyces coffeae]
MRAQRRSMRALLAWSLLEAVPVLLSGQLMAAAMDHGFLAGDPVTGLALLGAYGAALLLGAFGTRQVMTPMATVVESVRDRLVRLVVSAALRESVARPEAAADDAVVARTTRQTEAARQLTAGLLLTARPVVFSLGAVVFGLVTLVPQIAAVTVAALCLSAVLLLRLSRGLRERYLAALAAEERLAAVAGEALSGLRDVLACGATHHVGRRMEQAVDAQAQASMASAWYGARRIGVIVIGAKLPLLITLVMGPWLIRTGTATPGAMLGAATYLITALEPALRQVVQAVANVGLHLGVLLGRLADQVREQPPTRDEVTSPPGGSAEPAHTGLTLEKVTFAYGPDSEPVVESLDLTVKEGEHLAVMGVSGAGKSTLAALLAGLESPDAGTVSLGSRNVSGLDAAWLRRTVTLVPQQSYVFAGTVRENLTYARPGATEADVAQVVDTFGLTDLVARWGGLDAALTRPGALSQGERQLLVLARTHLSPARVVILDEATCHLDPAAEAVAEQAFMARPGTLVVIAHRASSILRAPRVLVLQPGGVMEGSHRDLIGRSPLYTELVGEWGGTAGPPR